MENLILRRNQSARSIRNVLSYTNSDAFIERSIGELRGRLAHVKSQWKIFVNKSAVLAAREENAQEKRRIWKLYDHIERDYLMAKTAIVERIREIKLVLQNEKPEQEDLLEKNPDDENMSMNSDEQQIPENVELNDESGKQGDQMFQNMHPAMMWQLPSYKSIENTWGEFSGTLTQWQGFHDRFKAAVIPRAFKFQYLQKSLEGQAAAALGEWQLSDENYNEAWDRLKELYEREYQTSRQIL